MANLDGVYWIMANPLYGLGLRIMECLRLRVKDIDFDYQQISVRNGKGKKDRVTMLPEIIENHPQQQLEKCAGIILMKKLCSEQLKKQLADTLILKRQDEVKQDLPGS